MTGTNFYPVCTFGKTCVNHFPFPILSLCLSFSPPDVLCDLIWRKGTPFEAMTAHTAPSSDGFLAEVFLSCKANARRCVHPYH